MPTLRVPKLSAAHPLVLATAVEVRLRWSYNGKLAFNVLHGIVAGGFINSQAHANALGSAVLARFGSSGLQALCATTTQMLGVGIRDLRTPNEGEFPSVAAAVAGTGAGNPMPNEVAAVVTLRTAKAGKSYRGRAYFSGAIVGENTAAGQIVGAFNTALAAFMTGVQTDMGTEGIVLAVLSRPRYANLVPPLDVQTYPGHIEAVTTILTRDIRWDSQRRRQV